MAQINDEINKLKKSLLDMMTLTEKQLLKGREAIATYDYDLAHEILYYENKVNAQELKIDSECENILALFNPVAIDLRFVLAVYKTGDNVERLGDYAEGIAHHILQFNSQLDSAIMNELRFDEMYSTVLDMYQNIYNAFNEEDTKLARKVFQQDKTANEINAESTAKIIPLIHKHPDQTLQLLSLLSIMRKLERVGDLIKNIAEDTIFYVEAKVLKHKGKLKSSKKSKD